NNERVTPIEIKNPLPASRVTGEKGMKKKNETNKVAKSVNNDNLLKNNTFFDSIILIISLLIFNYITNIITHEGK
ncbi:MAG: hypothetical protein PHT84_00690, partial [Candidatus Pacebacteria bacterium]|nr:hypothetical protein [Candidatus Paceibacterota bacterium]